MDVWKVSRVAASDNSLLSARPIEFSLELPATTERVPENTRDSHMDECQINAGKFRRN